MLAQYLSYEFIALFMFITMLVMMFTGQRVFGAIGFLKKEARTFGFHLTRGI